MKDKDLTPLSKKEVTHHLKSLPGWNYSDNKITKTYEFDSFTEAVQFVNGLVGFCNYLDHHPDITISYKKIRFDLTRFSVGGKVTRRDITVANKIEDDFKKYATRKVK